MQTVDAGPPPSRLTHRKATALTQPDPDFADTPPDRRALRRTARAARGAFAGALAPAVRRGLERALAAIALPHLGAPATLGSYAAVGDELDPAGLDRAAAELGWQTAFPRVQGAAPLVFHAATRSDLAPGFRDIPEPPADAPPASPDVLLVPLLATDLSGNRLGQGAGHYDRTLSSLRALGPVLAIGIAWDMQILPRLPAESWDQPLDAIATPTAFHLVAHGARGRA
jgi:5-formyltetrahydrofolate cyclo-ligase